LSTIAIENMVEEIGNDGKKVAMFTLIMNDVMVIVSCTAFHLDNDYVFEVFYARYIYVYYQCCETILEYIFFTCAWILFPLTH
jgi:hypothetical protein